MSKVQNISMNNMNLDPKYSQDQEDMCVPTSLKINDNSFELMTESEVIQFLRIPEISNSNNYHNVIENLKRLRKLPRIHICNKVLYPTKAIIKWIEQETTTEK
ncbi:hypothetical protein ACFLZ8_02955 [Planctomycetota bacterium]